MTSADRERALVAYLPPEAHGMIGDRRTAALVGADGTLDWLCLPDYGGDIIFGAALDAMKGGHWKLGPAVKRCGEQDYLKNTAVLLTRWFLPEGELELLDFMPWPETRRTVSDERARVIIRRLATLSGNVPCLLEFAPRFNFRRDPLVKRLSKDRLRFEMPRTTLHLWSNHGFRSVTNSNRMEFGLSAGKEVWFVLEVAPEPSAWSVSRAKKLLTDTTAYWREWNSRLECRGPNANRILRSAQTIHLLTYAPDG